MFLITTKGIPLLNKEDWSEEIKDFRAKCFMEQKERPSAPHMLGHPFMEKACSERDISQLVCKVLVTRNKLQWGPQQHSLFPDFFRNTVLAFILSLKRVQSQVHWKVPKVIIFEIVKLLL